MVGAVDSKISDLGCNGEGTVIPTISFNGGLCSLKECNGPSFCNGLVDSNCFASWSFLWRFIASLLKPEWRLFHVLPIISVCFSIYFAPAPNDKTAKPANVNAWSDTTNAVPKTNFSSVDKVCPTAWRFLRVGTREILSLKFQIENFIAASLSIFIVYIYYQKMPLVALVFRARNANVVGLLPAHEWTHGPNANLFRISGGDVLKLLHGGVFRPLDQREDVESPAR